MDGQQDTALLLGRYRTALVVLRSFLGVVYLTNGLAKLFGWHAVTIGTWHTYLINRDDALGIQKSNTATAPWPLHDLGNVVISNWGAFQWLLTLGELTIGLGLLLGLLSRLSALGGLMLALAPFAFTLGNSGTWTYDYLFEPIGLLTLLMAPSLPGLDSRLPWGKARGGPPAEAESAEPRVTTPA